MEGVISKLLLGKGIERFKILTTVYLITTSIFITNFIINQFGYFYNSSVEITYNSFIHFLLSKEAVLVLITAIMVAFLLFILFPLVFFALSYVISKIGLKLLFWSLRFHLKRKKINLKKREFRKSFNMVSILAGFNVFISHKNIIYEGINYPYFKSLAQDLITEENYPLRNAYTLNSIFLSSTFICYVYDIHKIVGVFFGLLLIVSVYWMMNTMVMCWLHRMKDEVREILIHVKPRDEFFDNIAKEIIQNEQNSNNSLV